MRVVYALILSRDEVARRNRAVNRRCDVGLTFYSRQRNPCRIQGTSGWNSGGNVEADPKYLVGGEEWGPEGDGSGKV